MTTTPLIARACAALLAAIAWAAMDARAELPVATSSGILFRCRAPGAATVYLAGSFNNWADNDDGRIVDDTFRMEGPDADGLFTKVVRLEPGAYRFQFAVDGRKGQWFVPPEIEELDADSNGVIRIAHDGAVVVRRARHPEWQPRPAQDGVRFRFYAPEAHLVYLAGSFNQWARNREGLVSDPRFAMDGPAADGTWSARVRLPAGSHAYQFVIDGDRWVRDPNEPQGDAQNHSVVVVP